MTPSPTLKKFLTDGTKPTSQREISALLDETFSLLKEIADGKSRITNQADFLTADQLAAKARPAPVTAKPTASAPVATAKPAPVSTKDQLVAAYKKARLSGQSTSAIVAQINKL
jgi:hypothetical protein